MLTFSLIYFMKYYPVVNLKEKVNEVTLCEGGSRKGRAFGRALQGIIKNHGAMDWHTTRE